MTITEEIRAWAEAIEEGDSKSAIELHDKIAFKIVRDRNGTQVFKEAGLDAQAFIAWTEVKKALKVQLSKSPEQVEADFEEGFMQAEDLLEKIRNAQSSREVIKWSGHLSESMRAVVMNATCKDAPEAVAKPAVAMPEPSTVKAPAPATKSKASEPEGPKEVPAKPKVVRKRKKPSLLD